MQKKAKKRLVALAAAAGSMLLWATAADALTVTIGIDAGSGIVNENSNNGFAFFSGAISGANGSFTSTTSAIGIPNLPSGQLLNSSSLNVSTRTGGTVTVYVTEQGLSSVGLNSFSSIFTVNPGNFTSVTLASYIDGGNGLFATTTLLNSETFAAIGTDTDFASATASGLYSLTEVYTVTLPAVSGTANAAINVSQTPLPAALPLFGSVLGGGLLFRKLRRRGCAV